MNPIESIKSFISRSTRVLGVSHRPRRDEFYETLKITGLGMILIGLLGYIISLIFGFIG